MRILVIDDSPIHQASARQTIIGPDLTIVGTYDEAHRLLEEPFAPWKEVSAELGRLGFNHDFFDDVG